MDRLAQIPKAEIPRSSFDRSHSYKTTFDAGWLIPIFVDEALPGDTFNLKLHALARMATPLYPVMDNIYLDTFFFAVPYRLVWDNWEKFCGQQTNPGDSTDYVIPKIGEQICSVGSVSDYLGLPLGTIPANTVSALPYRALNLIWNEWFRDQNLQDSVAINTDDGPDPINDYGIYKRGKRHDYFTAALPWPQKGPAVELPLGSSAPVVSTGAAPLFNGGGLTGAGLSFQNGTKATSWNQPSGPTPTATTFAVFGATTGLEADLSAATAATINAIRQAFQIQRLLERDARGGTRYTEIVRSHFGVTSPDARLQRPEYLGGGTTPININPLYSTTQNVSVGGVPLGQPGAVAVSMVDGGRNGFTWSATEHCVIIGLISARADLTYQQKLDRMWTRNTRYDLYWPALAMIGEQAILRKEIKWTGTSSDDEVFGYQERYAEYRYKPGQVTGLFRSDAATSLDPWHLAQDFGTVPVLNSSFIEEDPPIDRVIAVPTEPHFLLDAWFDFRCARPMPLFGVPGMLDHF